MSEGLPLQPQDCLELVYCTGRIIREDKREAINHNLPSILVRLKIDSQLFKFILCINFFRSLDLIYISSLVLSLRKSI